MALWTPQEITTALWLDADDASTLTLDGSDNIEQWDDKSGNGYHVTQSTTSERPSFLSNDLNGLPVVQFDEANNENLNVLGAGLGLFRDVEYGWVIAVYRTDITDTQNTERPVVVFTIDDSAASRVAFLNSGLNFQNLPQVGGRRLDSDSFGSSGMHSEPIAEQWLLQSGYLEFGERRATLWIDGEFSSQGTELWSGAGPTSDTDSRNARIGANGSSGSPSTRLHGRIAEVVVGNTPLANSDRQKIEGYLAHKWGLEASLPSNHPYKNEPPETTYADTILADNPIAYWPANEDSGTTIGDEAGNFDGALTGNYTLGVAAATGRLVAALGLTDGHFALSDTPLSGGEDEFSIEWWMRKDDNNSSYIMSRGNNDDLIVDFNSGKLEFFGGNFDRSGSAVDVPADNEWHHYVYTYDGTTLRGYVDAALVTDHEQTTTLSNSSDWRWGRSGGDGSPLNGALSDMAVYSVALTDTQIQAHYDSAFEAEPTLAGNATTDAGDPVDSVVISNWDTLEYVEDITPEPDGSWESGNLADGSYYLTYLADGFKPITHGPYVVDTSE